jgi:hypothetical protein
MVPFISLFLLTLSAGIAFYALSKYRPFRLLLFAYYVGGPFFLVFGFLQNWSMGVYFFLWVFGTWAGVLVYLAAFVVTTVFVSSRLRLSGLAAPFAVFSLLLLTAEAHSFVTQLEPADPESSGTQFLVGVEQADLPNVYHIILDGYDGGLFPQTLSPEYRSALAGFVNFPENVALYPSTRMSLPSIFSGKRQGGDVSGPEYMRRAFNSDDSFLYWLKKVGYTTVAYGLEMYEFELGLFDHVIYHRQNPEADSLLEMNTATFKRLWLWANSPRLFTRLLLSTEWFIQYGGRDLRLVRNGKFLPFSVPITSYLSFLNVLEQEAELPARGRYTLIHLAIPHQPEVLAPDCSYDDGGRETSQLEQAACATKLLVDFVERLKELGRFDGSLVIAHADHGVYELVSDAESHSPERVSLQALLLIKPIGSNGALAVSNVKSTVVDIAPTLLKAVGVENQLEADGASLLEAMSGTGLVQMD